MRQYLESLNRVLIDGKVRKDRTGTGTVSLFGDIQLSFDLSQGFPIQTTKRVSLKNVAAELLWFLAGDTRVSTLVRQGVNIWVPDWKRAQKSKGRTDEECEQALALMRDCGGLPLSHPCPVPPDMDELSLIYGHQWRNFFGTDQILEVLDSLKNDPYSRRHMVSAWNPAQTSQMALPPCHVLFQFYVEDDNLLSCKMYQRSADSYLGVPYNIASYALLTHLVARHVGMTPHKLYLTFGDYHIYLNHVDAVNTVLSRVPRELPTLWLNPDKTDIFDFTLGDIRLDGYDPHPAVKAEISVGV